MIHLFAICNIETGIGHEIFVNKPKIKFQIDPTLLWPLVSALTAFSREFVSEGQLRSVHLADFQLVMYNPHEENANPIAYIVLQDIFDNVEYTKAKIEAIDKILSVFISAILDSNFSRLDVIPKSEQNKIKKIIKFSQHFPRRISKRIKTEIERLQVKGAIGMRFLSLYIADLDEGIVNHFGENDPNEQAIFQSFIPIIPSKRDLWFEAKRTEVDDSEELDKEGWIIKRIGVNTDFLLMSRFYYKNEIKPFLEALLNRINSHIYEAIKDNLPKRPF
ncbi:MAG: hypothetical protein ACXADY_20215 [Candidatus Hodarchaeales archaeon]|jgi:hypothetical protein